MGILDYVIVGAIVGAIIGLFYYLLKKDNERLAKYVATLTEEQKGRLNNAVIKQQEKNAWSQEALIVDIKDKGRKSAVVALYCNRVINNATMNQICHADLSVYNDELKEKNVTVGSYVELYIDPDKSAWIM